MTNESNEEMERKYTDLFNKLDRGSDGELGPARVDFIHYC